MTNPFTYLVPTPLLRSHAAILLLLISGGSLTGQENQARGRNNPYSPSPNRGADSEEPRPDTSQPDQVSFIMRGKTGLQMPVERTSMARNLADASKPADALTVPPSEKYKVGVGDVLFVDLKNSPQGSGYYTVRRDGTIDYPLAGENVLVADQTAGFVAEMLAAGITLFPNPRVEVKVREYVSHQITVSGMVERPGNKVIQREAVPLYVIRAEAGVDVMAMKVSVKRTPDAKAETYDLRKPDTDNILIYAGNSVEFTSENGSSRNNVNGFFFISGEVVSAGQKEFISNLTLYQAVIAAGGVKGNPKKATIRRKNDKAVLSASDYNLRSIKEGKAVDPALFAGDIIEIRN